MRKTQHGPDRLTVWPADLRSKLAALTGPELTGLISQAMRSADFGLLAEACEERAKRGGP